MWIKHHRKYFGYRDHFDHFNYSWENNNGAKSNGLLLTWEDLNLCSLFYYPKLSWSSPCLYYGLRHKYFICG